MTDGFSPGNIVSDANFYDGRALDAGQIQTFLNQRVPRCTIGDPGRTAGMKWGETRIASQCLRNFSMNTQSRPANAYCAAYSGRSGESAAQIIAKVGQACGISQRVLLIMLEKEQSLVTDSWPTVRQFDVAMGYACPDSGPGGSANCDPTQTGFYQQVYRAAWQLQVYRANPNSYNYKPFQNNRIQWHPNAGCGTSNVYIENWATAALYIYTPYRPNQAALNAGWGTGDSCSSYGNRNFYNFYKTWFGDPRQSIPVLADIAKYWNARGAGQSTYGFPTAPRAFYSTRFQGGVWLQHFEGGIITTEMRSGKTVGIPYGRVFTHYNGQTGGVRGELGAPVAEPAQYTTNGGGVLQWFQGGFITTSTAANVTASMTFGPVYDLYNSPEVGGIYGELGFPVSVWQSYTGGKLQNFQRGFIAQATGAKRPVFMAPGAIYSTYNTAAVGGIRGRLGYPMKNAETVAPGVIQQEFQNGLLVQRGGAVIEVSGAEFRAYRAAETAGEPLGLVTAPKRSYTANGGGDLTQFERGIITTERKSQKTSYITGAHFQHYNDVLGGIYGDYGFPVANPRAYAVNGGGTLQLFQNGLQIVADGSSTVAAMSYTSPVYARYNDQEGGIYGWLGFPIADEVRSGDGARTQQFQNGTVVVDAQGRASALPKGTSERYVTAGGAAGELGEQQGSPRRYTVQGKGSAWLSLFAGGMIVQADQGGVAVIMRYSSPIYRYYNEQAGGIYGTLGYPLGDEFSRAGVVSQQFQGGTLILKDGKVSVQPR
ncbi:LGFP repeat-containing protein [Leucobacter manosquensis]|uniref:LGFP repeat-containing protein n=1 Tax=Leucobacter manosquensis TaxID=2810611 RepID=A0ABS5M4E8_9MICO|nr:hypothetical protein [Leucobacter manosquensis]